VADAIKAGYNACLREGETTRDLGGKLSLSEFTDHLIRRLGAAPE
jgi:isocitrate/isopropylmalate dehydrogenase